LIYTNPHLFFVIFATEDTESTEAVANPWCDLCGCRE